MKRILCMILCLTLLLSLSAPAAAAAKEEEELLEVTLVTYSNLLGIKELSGLYRDNTLYMHPSVLASLMGCQVELSEDQVIFTFSGVWTARVGKNNKDIPTVEYNGAIYLSAPHILRYVGATVGFGEDETAQIHMMVSMPYTVLDLWGDFNAAGGYRFSWSEAEGKWVDPEDILMLAALDTVLLGYESNVVSYAIPGRGDSVEEDIYMDILLELLRNDGTDLSSAEDPRVQLFGQSSDLLDLSSDWLEEVMDWIEDDTFSAAFHSTMGAMMDGAGIVVSASGDYLESLEVARQFANMTTTQKELLDNTLNRIPESDPNYQTLPKLFSASDKVSDFIGDEYAAEESAAWDGVTSLMNNAVDSWLSVSNPISFAWSTMTGILKLDPLVSGLLEAERNVTFAAETDNIRVIADDMISDSVSRLDAHNLYIGRRNGKAIYEQLRYEIILSLKASLTSRLLLIDSGFLTEEASAAMEKKAAATAQLLNKAQNAQPIPVGIRPSVTEDLTWIAKLAGVGEYGYAVDVGDNSYYWKLPDGAYEESGLQGWFEQIQAGTLVRRDEKGKETELFRADGVCQFAVTATHIFTTENNYICSRDLKGENYKQWGKGEVLAVSGNGKYVVCTADEYDGIVVIQPGEGTRKVLSTEGQFERLYGGLIYYTLRPSSGERAQKGQLILRCVELDGSNDRLVIETAADLYSYAMDGYAEIGQMRFGAEGLYFSYGRIGGTGVMYQGGRIQYVSYDGTQSRVIAGENAEADADFSINADGTVNWKENDPYVYFEWHRLCYMADGSIYWVDPVNGRETLLADSSTYARSDISYETATLDYACVTDGYGYFAIHYMVENPDESFGWRIGYDHVATVLYRKDLTTGETIELNIVH